MRTRIVVIVLIVISLLTASCSAPWNSTSSPSTQSTSSVKPAGKKITLLVDSGHPLNVEIPNVGHISGPAGAFSRSGSITIQPETASFASSSILRASGAGVDVAFDGTSLRRPLILAFNAGTKPSADAVPLVAHQSDDGQWNFLPARLDSSGRITVQTSSFSPNIPIWGSAVALFHGLMNSIASGVGGRTSPLPCPGRPPQFLGPSWFHLDPQHSDLVHTCVITNHNSNGQVVAEVQIKSNRGISLQVDVPGNPSYVWVEGQTWPGRQKVANRYHFDPNQTVILPAGKTMTVGYTRWATSLPVSFFVSGATYLAAMDTLTNDVIDTLFGENPNPYVWLAYTEVKCPTGFEVKPATHDGISLPDLHHFLNCVITSALGELKSTQTAVNVASQFGGSEADVATLVKSASVLKIIGWIVTLWPYIQVGIGNDLDKIHELISGGQSALVTWHMDPPGPTKSSGGTQSNQPPSGGLPPPSGASPTGSNPAVTLAQGPVVSGGIYRYAVTLSGFPANVTVSVECYDSVSPSGFYSFSLATDSSGNAFTQSQCYSGDGPDHWVVANGITSNHVQWGGTSSSPPSPPPTYSETVGGDAHTWTNYTNAGGVQGPTIPAYQTVQIACKVTGFRVADGNTWWYRIASAPWSNVYYVSADAFYNNGATSGPLQGTPFVDPAVPDC